MKLLDEQLHVSLVSSHSHTNPCERTHVATKAPTKSSALPEDFDHPNWKPNPDAATLLAADGYPFKTVVLPIDDVRGVFDAPSQVRNHTHMTEVRDYAEAFRQGAQFPVGIVDADNMAVDLYHRALGAREAGLEEIVVLQIQKRLSPEERNLIAARLNMTHGIRMSAEEIREIAIQQLAAGKSPEWVAEKLKLSTTTVKRYADQTAMAAKARDLGVETQFAKLNASVAAAIPTNMHAPVLRDTIRLLADSRATGAKAAEIVTLVQAAPTDAAAKRVIKDLRAQRVPKPGQSVVRAMTFEEAAGRITQRVGLFRATLQDTVVTTALKTGEEAHPSFKVVRDMLTDLAQLLAPLNEYFGVE